MLSSAGWGQSPRILSLMRRGTRLPYLLIAILAFALIGAYLVMRPEKPPEPRVIPQDAWATPDRFWSGYPSATPITPTGRHTYYASPGGDDHNSGDSAKPWRTLQHAAEALTPGDTLLLEDGEYPGGIKIDRSGTAGHPITYAAVHPGRATIHADRNAAAKDGILIKRADYVVIDGLVVHDASRAGIRLERCGNAVIRRCRCVQNSRVGIVAVFSDDLLVEYNECAYSGVTHGIFVSASGDRPVIRFNSCHDNARAGIQVMGDSGQLKPDQGKRGDGMIDGAVIEGNVIYGNGSEGASAINLSGVRDGRIVNNLIFHNLAGGIALYNDHPKGDPQFGSRNDLVVHNTIYFQPGEGRYCVSVKLSSTDNVLRNNILCGGKVGAYEFDATSSFTSDFNLLYSAGTETVASNETAKTQKGLSEWQAGKNDAHSVWADPSFASPEDEPLDFHPKPSSPAAGMASVEAGITTDMEGKARGGKRCVGALEAR